MMGMKPDAVIEVRFLTYNEGGRLMPINSESYGCPLIVGKLGFDCRFILDQKICFTLGETYQISVKFLDYEDAVKHLKEGSSISLWEGKTIAIGEVVNLFI